MREADPDKTVATFVVAVLALLGVLSFTFAGITIFERWGANATSSLSPSPLSRGFEKSPAS